MSTLEVRIVRWPALWWIKQAFSSQTKDRRYCNDGVTEVEEAKTETTVDGETIQQNLSIERKLEVIVWRRSNTLWVARAVLWEAAKMGDCFLLKILIRRGGRR